MQVYLVGGAVRDEMLGRTVTERDWVVVGATPEEMQRLGYQAVGREFPVFLHPQTKEEYALARLERKTGPGYRGFVTEFSAHVTLEQDLQRRDLTINAMARSADGTLIDPYDGRSDLQRRQLRHVSPAFAEDPVRVLRVARFAARFAESGFKVADATLALMRQMAANGEVAALVPERVWREMERALAESTPESFFDTLADCGALPIVLPELRWRAQDREALRAAARATAQASAMEQASVRFAAIMSGTALADIERLCERLRVSNPLRELALLCARLQPRIDEALQCEPAGLLALLEDADAFRRPERFDRLLLSAAARAPGNEGLSLLREAAAAAACVTLPSALMHELKGAAIAAALRTARLERLEALQSERRRS